jgi:hypothetical protein
MVAGGHCIVRTLVPVEMAGSGPGHDGGGSAVTVGALFAACCQASLAGRTPSIWAIA